MNTRVRRTNLALAGVVMALLMAATGCSSDGDDSDDDPIAIGASVSLSGKYASSGTSVANGYQLAVDTINADGGINGRKLELSVEDDKSDPATVTRIYTSLLADGKADLVLSPYGSALAGPAMELSERYKKPMVHSLTPYAPAYQKAKYSVMAGIGRSERVLADVPTVAKEAGLSSIGIVTNDLDSYTAICDGVADAAESTGLSIVARESYAATTSDFSSLALKIKDAKPDVVVECSAIQDSIGLTRAINQQGFYPKMLVSTTAEEHNFLESLGELADRAIGYSTWAPELKLPASEKFASDYEKKFGAPATNQAASGFAAVQVLAEALKAAESSEPEAVNEKLHSGSYQTILGAYKVDEHGVQTGYAPVLNQYQEGVLKVIYPESDVSVDLELPYRSE